MNLQAICVANFTGFLLILFLLISRFITEAKSQAEDYMFNVMMYLAMFACLIEPLTFFVDGKPGALSRWINLLGNTYLYFANGLGSFLWCMYVDQKLYHDRNRIIRIYGKAGIVVAVMLLSLFLNLPFGHYFYVDDANVYHRNPMIYIFYLYMFVCLLWSVITLYRYRHSHGKVAFFPIFMYLVPIAVGSLLQMVFYGVSLAWLGTAVGIVAIYMSILNQKSYLDNLTGLYNRTYLEHVYYRMKRNPEVPYYGIMLDMNYFKEINDTYGHSAGDQALIDMAFLLRENESPVAISFRYAGDEFVVLMKAVTEKEVASFEQSLRDRAEEFNGTGKRPYRLSFAMGHAAYDHEEDDEDTFSKKIDAAMYENKLKMHRERSGEEQGQL